MGLSLAKSNAAFAIFLFMFCAMEGAQVPIDRTRLNPFNTAKFQTEIRKMQGWVMAQGGCKASVLYLAQGVTPITNTQFAYQMAFINSIQQAIQPSYPAQAAQYGTTVIPIMSNSITFPLTPAATPFANSVDFPVAFQYAANGLSSAQGTSVVLLFVDGKVPYPGSLQAASVQEANDFLANGNSICTAAVRFRNYPDSLIDGITQVSGNAEYVMDYPDLINIYQEMIECLCDLDFDSSGTDGTGNGIDLESSETGGTGSGLDLESSETDETGIGTKI